MAKNWAKSSPKNGWVKPFKIDTVLGIDPGNNGGLAFLYGDGTFRGYELPVEKIGKETKLNTNALLHLLEGHAVGHIFLERALPFAMGAKHAFNYGIHFGLLLYLVSETKIPYTLVEPAKWTKEMHAGIHSDMKPKAKSIVAVKRLFPKFVKAIPVTPKSKKMHDGVVDALLIAGYGLRQLSGAPAPAPDFSSEDFM